MLRETVPAVLENAIQEVPKNSMMNNDTKTTMTNIGYNEDLRVNPVIAHFDKSDSFTFKNFIDRYQGTRFADEKTMIEKIEHDICKVFCKIQTGSCSDVIIMKGDKTFEFFDIRPCNSDCTPLYFYYGTGVRNDDVLYKKIKFIQFVKAYPKHVPHYSGIESVPHNTNLNFFNIWPGYKAVLVPEINMDVVNPILELIKTVWCSNNLEYYNYFLTWLYYLIARPETKTRKCIFGYSHERGNNKLTLWNFLRNYVLGIKLMFPTSGLEYIPKKRYWFTGKKLIIVDYAQCTPKDLGKCLDRINYLFINEAVNKNYLPFDELLNFVVLSNSCSEDMLKNAKERGYWCLEVSEPLSQDIKYDDELRAKCFNDNAGNHFYTYIMNFNPTIGICDTPN